MEYTLGELGSADPSQLPVHSQPPGWQGAMGSTEGLDSVSAAQPEQKHPCVFNSPLNTNPKHSPAPATLKKTTLSQSKPAHKENTALAQATQTVLVLSPSVSDQHEGLCLGNTHRHTMWAGTVLIQPIYPVPAGTWGAHKPPETPAPLIWRHTNPFCVYTLTHTRLWTPPVTSHGHPAYLAAGPGCSHQPLHTHMQTGLTVNPRPHTLPCACLDQ